MGCDEDKPSFFDYCFVFLVGWGCEDATLSLAFLFVVLDC